MAPSLVSLLIKIPGTNYADKIKKLHKIIYLELSPPIEVALQRKL